MKINFKKDYLSLFPESPEDIGLNEKTMRFEKDREDKYWTDRMANFLSKKRLAIVMGVIIFILFGIVDWILIPETKGIVWFLRFALIVPMFLAVFSISYIEKFADKMPRLIAALVIVMGLIHVISMGFLPQETVAKFHMSFLILILYSFIMMSPDFILGTISTVSISLFYSIFVMTNNGVPGSDKILGLIVVVLTAAFGVIFTYYSEYVNRRIYVIGNKVLNTGGGDKNSNSREIKKLQGKKKKGKKQKTILDTESEEIDIELLKKDLEKTKADRDALRNEINKIKEKISNKSKKTGESGSFSPEEHDILKLEIKDKTKELEEKEREISDLKTANSVLLQKLEDTDYNIKALEDKLLSKTTEIDSLKNSESLNGEKATGSENDNSQILTEMENKLAESAEKIEELELKNANLIKDADNIMKQNLILKDEKQIVITEKSADDIKLMGRLGAFVSTSLVKNFSENLQFLSDHEEDFKKNGAKDFLEESSQKMAEALYMAGSVSYKFDLFRRSLESNAMVTESVSICNLIQNSIGQLASFFSGSNHMVDVSCKDNVKIRMNEESFKLIIQNLVLNSLLSVAKKGVDALIELKVREEKSKVVVEYEDNGKSYPNYCSEILKLEKIDSSILSVNGIEIYLANELIKTECGGNLNLVNKKDSNKIIMSFIK